MLGTLMAPVDFLATPLAFGLYWWTDLLVLTCIYALLALSLNFINGYAKMFSLGHHGFYAMGAYGAAWLTRALHDTAFYASVGGPVVFVLSALFAMFVAAIGGIIIGLPCLRLRGDYLAIATLGFGEIVRIALANSSEDTLGGSVGLSVPRILIKKTRKSTTEFYLLFIGIGVVLVILVAWAIRNYIKSAKGRALLATAQDERAAGLLGINPTSSKVTSFVLGSSIAGLAGALYAHYQATISPLEFPFMETVKIFLIVVLGGLGSISGCLVAAFLLTFVEKVLGTQLPESVQWLQDWWQVEYAAILVLLMIFLPRGMFGNREITDLFKPPPVPHLGTDP